MAAGGVPRSRLATPTSKEAGPAMSLFLLVILADSIGFCVALQRILTSNYGFLLPAYPFRRKETVVRLTAQWEWENVLDGLCLRQDFTI